MDWIQDHRGESQRMAWAKQRWHAYPDIGHGKRAGLAGLLGGACLDVAVMRCMLQRGLGTQDQV